MTVTTATGAGIRPLADDLREYDARTPRNRQAEEARAEGKFGLGPSDYLNCRAQLGYTYNPPADYVPDEVSHDAAIIGTLIHEGITARRAALYPERWHDIEIPVPGLDKPGHADEYDPETATLVDFKSAGEWVWGQVSSGKVDGMPKDWGQLRIYALGLRAVGVPVERLRLVYVSRMTNSRSGGLSVEFEQFYDEEEALAALAWEHDVMDALEAGAEPGSERLPRDRRGPSSDTICAKFCPAVRHCWRLDEVPPGRSPESWHIVGTDAAAAAEALAELHDVQAEASKATKAVKETKSLIEGLPEGVYPGGFLLEWSGGSAGSLKPDPEDSIATLRAALAAEFVLRREAEWWASRSDEDAACDGGGPTPQEREEWVTEGQAYAAAVELPLKLSGKRAHSPKVSRVTLPATVLEIPVSGSEPEGEDSGPAGTAAVEATP